MKRRELIQSLAMTVLGTGVLLSTRATAASPPEKPEQDERLSVGETLRFDDGLSVTFLAVLNDGRCPINATCISAGHAEVLLRVKAGNQKAKLVTLHTDGRKKRRITIPANVFPEGQAGIPKSYTISIARLNPLPFAGKKTLQSDYRVKLKILVAL
ncbi:MAG: hypothetical protein EOP85_19315 [Verrucomicrobiaceae bacterium]|nr:MAG: hypothetical protein EOP85_19315 [Verrucomicrobiaceae bacterium]